MNDPTTLSGAKRNATTPLPRAAAPALLRGAARIGYATGILGYCTMLLAATGAQSDMPAPQTVALPPALAPAPNETLAIVTAARGVQIYECRAAADKDGRYAWTFVAPEAELFDASGNAVGRHYAGPRWRASDGSSVLGATKARADAPQSGAIAWLLLATTADPGPSGRFSQVSNIRRVNTRGGVAPSEGCTADTVGRAARVPYTADYYFYTTAAAAQ